MLVDSEGWKGLVSENLKEEYKSKFREIKEQIFSNKKKFTFLRKDNNNETFSLILDAQDKFKAYKKILLIGTGGSSLGAKAFLSFTNNNRIEFLETLDPSYVITVLEKLKKKKTGLVIISKSGETVEVLCLLDIIVKKFHSNINLSKDALIISDNKKSKLNKIANHYNIKFMNHDPAIGGRYSCFSITGLIPLQLAGANSKAIKEKADQSFIDNLTLDKFNNFEAVNILAGITKNKLYTGHVFLVYIESFSPLGNWYRQLWAESLGKHQLGLHLMTALGPVDQHSQLQIWLDGPNNLIFTIIIPKKRKIDIRTSDVENILPYHLQGKNIGEILNVMAEATVKELKKANRPVRVIYVDDDTINSAVNLMTTLLLEVAFIGELIGINPFNQPSVEKIKNTTKHILDNYDRN